MSDINNLSDNELFVLLKRDDENAFIEIYTPCKVYTYDDFVLAKFKKSF